MDIDPENKRILAEKIREINKKEFQPICTATDGKCLTMAILRRIEEEEANHLELRNILIDYVLNTEYEAGNSIFQEENYKNKGEYT